MNVLAMIGYAAYPLMPPRLLNDCATAFGGCQPGYQFVDTMDVYGGLWSWRQSTVEKVIVMVHIHGHVLSIVHAHNSVTRVCRHAEWVFDGIINRLMKQWCSTTIT